MKRRILCILASIMFILLVLNFAELLLPKYHLSSRYAPDGTSVMGYIEPDEWYAEKWISSHYTVYENGEAQSQTIIQKHLFDKFTVKQMGKDDQIQKTTYYSSIGSAWSVEGTECITITDYLDGATSADFLSMSSYWKGEGQKDCDIAYQVTTGTLRPKRDVHPIWEAHWDEAGRMIRQDCLNDFDPFEKNKDIMAYVIHEYDNKDRLKTTNEYDGHDTLLRTVAYQYEGRNCTKIQYNADGIRTGYMIEERDILGRIKQRSQYDADGKILNCCEYSYNSWEMFVGWQGVWTILMVVALSVSVYILVEKIVVYLEERRM